VVLLRCRHRLRHGPALPQPERGSGGYSHPNWRSSAIGIYRFWRDLGYGIGALCFGLVAHLIGSVTAGFWFVAIVMFLSGALVMA
jgi:hypothetical protein